MTGIDQPKIDYVDGQGIVSFPLLAAWLDADPDTNPEVFRGSTVANLEGAAAYARALLGIVLALLDPAFEIPKGNRVLAWVDLDSAILYLEGPSAATRRELADKLARAAEIMAGAVDDEHARWDAADDLAARQARTRQPQRAGQLTVDHITRETVSAQLERDALAQEIER